MVSSFTMSLLVATASLVKNQNLDLFILNELTW